MTDKEVRKLKKPDLLEILYHLRQENEELRQENERLRAQFEVGMALQETELDKIKEIVSTAVKNALNISGQENVGQDGNEA